MEYLELTTNISYTDKTVSHKVVSSTPYHVLESNLQTLELTGTDCIDICKSYYQIIEKALVISTLASSVVDRGIKPW